MKSSRLTSVRKLANGIYRVTRLRGEAALEPFVHCEHCNENIPLEGLDAEQLPFEHIGELHD